MRHFMVVQALQESLDQMYYNRNGMANLLGFCLFVNDSFFEFIS